MLVQGAGGRVLDRQGGQLDTLQPQGFVLCSNAQLNLYSLFGNEVASFPAL
jgi:hypothetical protein